jgi:dihydropteroate synthase
MIWKTRRQSLDLSRHGVVMGILNVTPDSFSDGGAHDEDSSAMAHALLMISQGAQIIDIGGESTRPGAPTITLDHELDRVIPLIADLRKQSDVLISIDTSKALVAAAALEVGADIVNDVTGMTGSDSGQKMVEVCAQWGSGIVVMHMQGNPRTMQGSPDYEADGGVVAAVNEFFKERLAAVTAQGIDPDCICFDPGIGFGKTLEDNLALLRHLGEMQNERPLLLGVSRKSLIGTLTGEEDPSKRDVSTAAITALACQQGIRLHRVHDVKKNVDALKLAEAIYG